MSSGAPYSKRSSRSTLMDELLAEIGEKLHASEPVDLEAYVRQYPERGEQIRRMLPAMQALAALGQTSESPSQSAFHVEQHRDLGDFRLIREIGRGGMGVVYEALQVSLGRRVAVKILPFAALLNDSQLERFATEATAAARLQHPHIVPVYAVGCERGIHFYAMQLIDGPSLADVIAELRGKRVPDNASAVIDQPDTRETVVDTAANPLTRDGDGEGYYCAVARVGREAAEGLHYAHEHGVLHRDIKPSNLLVDSAGHVWIADFGLARVEEASQLTRTGDILGTLRYMSPEQATGQRDQIDARSDVYSLGATLYELATLRPPFDSSDRRRMIKHVIAGNPVPPHEIDHCIPRPLSLIISNAMARRQSDRYQSAQELAADLQRFLSGDRVRAKHPSLLRRAREWSRRHRLTSAAMVGLLVVTLLVTALTHHLAKRIPADSQSKGDVMKPSTAAKVAGAVAAMSMLASEASAGKPAKPPAEVINLVVAEVTATSITLQWESGGGTTATYIVAYNEGGEYPPKNLRKATVIDVGDVTSYEVGNLTTDQVHSFRVCAVNASGKRSTGITVQGTPVYPEYYEPYAVLDSYAEFVDESTKLGTFSTHAQQPDGKVLIGAIANDGPTFEGPGNHFIGRMNADGTVDNTFGVNGYHRMDILNDGDLSFDYTRSVTVLPNKKILVAGTTGGTIHWQTTAWYLIQYDEFGALDPEFGEGGIVIDTVPDVEVAKAFDIEVRPNGKIVAAAAVLVEGPFNYKCTVVQYNSDGSRDTSFGLNEGMTSFLPPGAIHAGCDDVAILSNGKIAVVMGCTILGDRFVSSVVMFNEDGTVDESFGNSGFAYVETWPETGPEGPLGRIGWEWFSRIVEQPDGKLLAVGTRAGFAEGGEFEYLYLRTMARFQGDGTVDTSFGVGGMVIPQKLPSGDFEAYDGVALQTDQKIVVMGFSHSIDAQEGDTDLLIERYNVDGSRDVSFNGTGRIVFSTLGDEMAHGLQILENGSIVIAGTHTSLEPGGLSRGLLLHLIPLP